MDEDSLGRNTAYQDASTVFDRLVRVGTVTDVDYNKRIARVKFPDLGYTSDWLPVLISLDTTPDYKYTDPQWTEFETEWKGTRTMWTISTRSSENRICLSWEIRSFAFMSRCGMAEASFWEGFSRGSSWIFGQKRVGGRDL